MKFISNINNSTDANKMMVLSFGKIIEDIKLPILSSVLNKINYSYQMDTNDEIVKFLHSFYQLIRKPTLYFYPDGSIVEVPFNANLYVYNYYTLDDVDPYEIYLFEDKYETILGDYLQDIIHSENRSVYHTYFYDLFHNPPSL
jgi:hypothetical protein